MYGGAHGVHNMPAVAGSPPLSPYMGYQGYHPGPRPGHYGGMVRCPMICAVRPDWELGQEAESRLETFGAWIDNMHVCPLRAGMEQ